MSDSCSCFCEDNSVNLIYSCSGGSNVGQITNEIAKKLSSNKIGKMSCGIALGANLNGFIISAQNACKNIIIDGCSVGCLKKVFENHKIQNIDHYTITDFDIKKNSSFEIDLDKINFLVKKISLDICNK